MITYDFFFWLRLTLSSSVRLAVEIFENSDLPCWRHRPTQTTFYLLTTVMARSHSKSVNLGMNTRTDESDRSKLKEAPKKNYDSDDLDDDSDDQSKKRKHASPKKKQPPRKKVRKTDENDEYEELNEGQEIVGVVVQAPKTGQVHSCRLHVNFQQIFAGRVVRCLDNLT
jgi:hypothetical protein